MCGIVGYIDKQTFSIEILKAMMDQIIHRGPDGSGIYLDSEIALGHRRLSIIDIEGGIQPMKNEDGRFVCIFNGEIYNYHELKDQLEEKGHVFATKSDTEVLLHGYEQWKEKLPEKLRGMFAFAIWDKKEKELFCARDYFGIKPFYYYAKEDVFLFGSEIKSFLPHPSFVKELNREQLELYLTYQYSPGANTFFKNVYKLLPGHFLNWKNGKITINTYWKPEFQIDDEMEEADGIEKIRAAMEDSVNVHKISDVEVGSFLSSGIDSSYIAALSKVNKTFTIGYENEKYNEGNCVKQFAESMHLSNQIFEVSPKKFWESISKVQYYMDEPLADASAISLYLLNQEAAKHVKVCLSGEGADELFAGYNIYKEPFMCKWYDGFPQLIRYGVGTIASMLPPRSGVNFLVRHRLPRKERYIGNTCLFSEKQKKKLLRQYSGKIGPMDLIKGQCGFREEMDDVSRMQMTDIHMWLAGDILLKADKMSMANGLELRVPFLDKEVFGVASRIPVKYRVNKKSTKVLLRNAAEEVIGKKASSQEKRGFPVPIREWLREEPYVSYVVKKFENGTARDFFHIDYLLKMVKEHKAGKKDWWREIWCVYMFFIWYEIFFS